MALTVPIQDLEAKLSNFYNENLTELCKVLTEAVVISSKRENSDFENSFILPQSTLNDKIILSVLSWWMPEEISFLLRLELESSWGGEFKEIHAVASISKQHALGVLIVSNRWNDRDFFGNILNLNRIKKFISRIRLRRKSKSKPKTRVFRRGYNDKGSRRPTHVSIGFNYKKLRSLTYQAELEAKRHNAVTSLLKQVEEVLFAS